MLILGGLFCAAAGFMFLVQYLAFGRLRAEEANDMSPRFHTEKKM